ALGYAPAEWRSLLFALRSRGFTEEELVGAGLVKTNEAGHKWDLLRHRIVIPIRDARGRVIAFGGRALGDEAPKYVNSPETELFSKRAVLFALDKASRAAAAAGCFVVVEGYMDVIAAHQRGVENVVAALGTAFTAEHVSQLRRHASQVVLLFDADEGGQRATDRGATLLLREGMDVAIVTLPEGQDPDDFLRAHDAAAFWRYLADHKEDMITYLIRRAREEAGRTAGVASTAKAARSVLKLLEGMDDAVQFDLYVRKISQEFGIDEALLRQDLRRQRGLKRPERADEAAPSRAERGMLKGWELDEVFILQAAATDAAVAGRVVEALSGADFRDPDRRAVFEAMRDIVKGSQCPAPCVVLERLKDNTSAAGALQAVLGRQMPPVDSMDCVLERMMDRRREAEYWRAREEAGRSGVLQSGTDDELDSRLDEMARYHAARYARSKDAERKRHDASEA
ncbi:MAG: toprim domain-containing protein, partial [Planctomycetes bacterium]|nr:toprim domain-containing protein [Planctomycetota bacterium]